jgi:guanosine-3',5'-bis(diphosphate) 3'-pyrophosphohydrolase
MFNILTNQFIPLIQIERVIILPALNPTYNCTDLFGAEVLVHIEDLIELLPDTYTQAERDLVQRAYRVADQAHRGQTRASGEPYIQHCLAVAKILAEMRVPAAVVSAGLLHDTVEDTSIILEDLRRDFGDEIAFLVDGVTKLTGLPRISRGDQRPEDDILEEEQRQVAERRGLPIESTELEQIARSRRSDITFETIRKTFMAMGEDVRVVLIKLADRLHNMRTLSYVNESKRRRIAQETLDIFAPLANRLGIWEIKWELEDLSFRYTSPDKYKEIASELTSRRADREAEMVAITERLHQILSDSGIKSEVTGRPKHIYSIYRKMQNKGLDFDLIHDVRAVRIIVPDVQSCYTTLGVIHTHWRPIPGAFDDYIASPKDNFYQSLHTAVIYDDAKTLEVQIRTPEMHQNAELGIAAHWRYKEGAPRDEAYERRIVQWRLMMDWNKDVVDAREFVDSLKTDVFEERVYVFTPKGDIIELPAGATPIDFAYHVHTDVGNRCRGAKVNGKLIPLDYVLKTGEKVEILITKRGGPSRDWLNPNLGLVKTQRARSKIRYWFKRQAREQNILQGKEILEKEQHRLGIADMNLEHLARHFGFHTVDEMHEALGSSDMALGRISNYLMLQEEDEEGHQFTSRPTTEPERQDSESITVVGLKGILTTMAKCCNPLPGDGIVGFVTRGRGATIHRQDCPNILRIHERERLIRVAWGKPKSTYPVAVRITAYDRDGLMRDVSNLVSDEEINMGQVKADVDHDHKMQLAVFDLILEVHDVDQLTRVLTRLEALPNVMEAHRVRPG